MASLLEGQPGSTSTTVSTQTPPWMQDAIYNTISWAQNLANKPYVPYEQARIAGFTPTEQLGMKAAVQEAAAYQPYLAQSGATLGRAAGLSPTQAAESAIGRAEAMSGMGAAQPFITQGVEPIRTAGATQALTGVQPYIGQAVGASPLTAAEPYLAQASRTFPGSVREYMSPYTEGVVNRIADLGVRQLRERLLPEVGEEFIRAGQFGGSRMGEFGARALRDVQEAILGEQSKALQAGYEQAADIFASDVGRAAQLAGTAGQLGGTQQRALLEAGQLTGQVSQQDLQRMLQSGISVADIGRAYGALAAQDASRLAEIGATRGALTVDELSRLQALSTQYGALGEAAQTLGLRGAAAVTGVGQTEREQAQRALDLAYQQFQEETRYPYEQIGFQAGIIGGFPPSATGTTTQTSTIERPVEASPLSQILAGLTGATALYKTWTGG